MSWKGRKARQVTIFEKNIGQLRVKVNKGR